MATPSAKSPGLPAIAAPTPNAAPEPAPLLFGSFFFIIIIYDFAAVIKLWVIRLEHFLELSDRNWDR